MNFLVSGLFSTAESYGSGTAAVEIIVMLLVAFILGYLLRYFLSSSNSGKNYKDEYDDLLHRYELLENQSNTHQAENRKLLADLDDCKQQMQLGFAQKQAPPAQKDNLKKIEGIGPKIEEILFAGGIYTWDGLSKTEVAYIQKLLDNAGPNYKVHDPASWPFQAKLAAEGKWEELQKWQDEHLHGKF